MGCFEAGMIGSSIVILHPSILDLLGIGIDWLVEYWILVIIYAE